MERRQIFLSVDFDFFCRELPEWDWGHSEHHSPLLMDALWISRYAHKDGCDIEKHASPHPLKFFSSLQMLGFDFNRCEKLVVGDSHKWASAEYDRMTGDSDVVNFDAHHDMGYCKPGVWRRLRNRRHVDCSNWGLDILSAYLRPKMYTVYPKWRGLQEIESSTRSGNTPWTFRKNVAQRFEYGVFSNEYVQQISGEVVSIYIAKSSAWLPPWQDEMFVKFVKDAERVTEVNRSFVREDLEDGLNVMGVRKFDQAQAEQLATMLDEIRKTHSAGWLSEQEEVR